MKFAVIIVAFSVASLAPAVGSNTAASTNVDEQAQPLALTGPRTNCPAFWVDPLCRWR